MSYDIVESRMQIENANDIQSFMKNTLNPILPEFRFEPLSEEVEIFLKRILFYIQEGKSVFRLENLIKEDLHFSGIKDFPRNPNYSAIPKEVRGMIEGSPKVSRKYSFEIKGRNYTVFFILPNWKKIPKGIDNDIRRIWEWFYLASNFTSGISCSPSIDIYLYWTDHKKELPRTYKEEIIERTELKETHINTGFTIACPRVKNEICIFRYEEWYKVLIHESFHSLGFDFVYLDGEPAQKALFAIFPIRTNIELSESYNEFWAEFLQIVFLCYKPIYKEGSHIEKSGVFSKVLKQLAGVLELEVAFSQFQATKVLYYYGLSYTDLYLPEGSMIRRHKYKEQSGAFAYYILKTIFLSYYPQFLGLCIRQNKGSLQIKKTQSAVLSLVDFIKDYYNRPHLVHRMLSIFNWIKGNRSHPVIKTLRFTLSE